MFTVLSLNSLCVSVCLYVCVRSKANAKRWEEECLQLRKGHAPKSTAEQEELQQLREENASMKKEVSPPVMVLLLC